jgi:hypothetical protein
MMAWPDRGTPLASQGASTNNCQPSRGQTLASPGPKTPIFGTNHLGGGIHPNPNSYHALTTNACQSHFLFPLSRNIDPVRHASSIHGCAPADTLISRLVILKSIFAGSRRVLPLRWTIGQENLIALALSTSLRPRTIMAPMN